MGPKFHQQEKGSNRYHTKSYHVMSYINIIAKHNKDIAAKMLVKLGAQISPTGKCQTRAGAELEPSWAELEPS